MRILIALTLAASLAAPLAKAQKLEAKRLLEQAAAAERAGDMDAAGKDFRAVLAASPGNVEALTGLGAILAGQGDLPHAIEEFKLALPAADQKQRPNVELALGTAYFRSGDFERARPELTAVLSASSRKLLPAQAKAAAMLAGCDLKRNDPAAALAVLTPFTMLAERDADLGRVLGIALVRTGKFHEGAVALHRAAELTGDAGLYLLAGSAWLDNAEFEDARRDLESAHRIDPRLAGLAAELSIARFAVGDNLAAEVSLHEAIRLQPDDQLANLYLGVALMVRGDMHDAGTYFERSLSLQPAIAPLLIDSAVTPVLSSRLDPAIAMLRKLESRTPVTAAPSEHLNAIYQLLARADAHSLNQSPAALGR